MAKKLNVLFGYQGAFELTKEEEETFVRDFPDCSFRFGPPDNYTDEECAQADIFIGMFNPRQMQTAKNLQWLQASTVGVDRYEGYVDTKKTLVSNSQNLFNKCMGEHTFAMMIAWSRALLLQRDSQNRHEWVLHEVPSDLFDKTVAVIGLGGIGTDVAKKCKAFEMHVIGVRRNLGNKPDFVDELYSLNQIDEVLAKADFVILAVPLTEQTYHLINRETLKKMKPTAYLLNVARGEVVDTDALVEALQNKTIAAAGLDTVYPEPLPADHPLWSMENVFITPHRANASPTTNRFRFKFYYENLKRYLAGEPLKNQVKM